MTETTVRSPRRWRSRREINPLDYLKRPWMQLTLFLSFLFLYFPIVTLVAFSFNDS